MSGSRRVRWKQWPWSKRSSGRAYLAAVRQYGAILRDDPFRLAEWRRGVGIVTEALASAPRRVVRELPDGSVEMVQDHPTNTLLSGWASPQVSTSALVERMHADVMLYGESCSAVMRDGSGRATGLKAAPQVRWNPETEKFEGPGRDKPAERNVLRVHGLIGRDGRPKNTVYLAAEDLDLAGTMRSYAMGWFERGGAPSGVFSSEMGFTEQQRQTLKESVEGSKRAHSVIVLDGDIEWKPIASTDAEKTQLLAAREDMVRVAARWLGISPILLGDLSRAAYSTAEHARLDLISGRLRPDATRWDLAMTLALLPDHERAAGLVIRTDLTNVVLGDRASRGAYFRNATGGNAWMSPNDVRRLEGMAPKDGADDLPRKSGMTLEAHMPGEGTAE